MWQTGFLALAVATLGGELIHSMDDLRVRLPKEKACVEAVEGKFGKAARFAFDEECRGAFVMTPIRGTPDWDRARGFSFWVKGDGSRRFGGLQFIWNEDDAARYDLTFPIDGTDWRKIDVAWGDLVPVLPGSPILDPKGACPPSRLSALWFGKWWYWRDYGSHSYAIDEIRLEPDLERGPSPAPPAGVPQDPPGGGRPHPPRHRRPIGRPAHDDVPGRSTAGRRWGRWPRRPGRRPRSAARG